jgi:adenine-specific DNA-methyltransferase
VKTLGITGGITLTWKNVKMIPVPLFEQNDDDHMIFNEDANLLIRKIKGDILYLDPPYNHRQYGANYHLLNTIALYDNFTPHGKTGLRDYFISDYCRKGRVKKVFEDLISNAKFKYIFLSYNNEGLMSLEDVKFIMSKYGEYDLITKKYQRFKADRDVNRIYKADSTFEYLHVLVKDTKTRQLSLF